MINHFPIYLNGKKINKIYLNYFYIYEVRSNVNNIIFLAENNGDWVKSFTRMLTHARRFSRR